MPLFSKGVSLYQSQVSHIYVEAGGLSISIAQVVVLAQMELLFDPEKEVKSLSDPEEEMEPPSNPEEEVETAK